MSHHVPAAAVVCTGSSVGMLLQAVEVSVNSSWRGIQLDPVLILVDLSQFLAISILFMQQLQTLSGGPVGFRAACKPQRIKALFESHLSNYLLLTVPHIASRKRKNVKQCDRKHRLTYYINLHQICAHFLSENSSFFLAMPPTYS